MVKFGLEFFLINQFLKNLLKLEWVKEKARPEFWVAVVKPGRILFEVSGVSRELAHEALSTCSYKLPIKTKWLQDRILNKLMKAL